MTDVINPETRLEGDPAARPEPEPVDRVRARLSEALYDENHINHASAVRELGGAYQRQFPDEHRAPQPGELRQNPATGAWEPAQASEAELAATVAPVIGRHLVEAGARPEEAREISEAAAAAGLTASEVASVLDGRQYTPDECRADLGAAAPELIERARVVVGALGPGFAEFLERTQLGNSPKMVRLLAERVELLEEDDA